MTIDSELLRYLNDLADKRAKEPKNDIISKLMKEQVEQGNLSKEDAIQMAFLLLVAGNATMVNMIALVSPSSHVPHSRNCQTQVPNILLRAS